MISLLLFASIVSLLTHPTETCSGISPLLQGDALFIYRYVSVYEAFGKNSELTTVCMCSHAFLMTVKQRTNLSERREFDNFKIKKEADDF
ncbi:hypothetical protein BC832DRAFT_433096 [Gaertneriomyces semiglobifer]|nr:hypothetical protein BC832DRAFT_433096 [Gaertneriomyces semiglobifer]